MMDCKTFRKYVGAFADGELEVEKNLEALEHLNMCPECTRRVENIHELRDALARIYARVEAPLHLRRRIAAVVDEQAAATDDKPQPARRAQKRGLRRTTPKRFRIVTPLAMAAALLLTVIAWQYRGFHRPRPGTVTVVSGQAVADVRAQHRQCLAHHGFDHHDESLPRTLPELSESLSRRLGLKVIVPDLSARGYKLAGAARCGIRDRPGAHVLYRGTEGDTAVSVFSAPRLPDLGPDALGTGNSGYFVAEDNGLTVIAWHSGAQTYAVCAALPKDKLMELVETVRLAAAPNPPRSAWLPARLATAKAGQS